METKIGQQSSSMYCILKEGKNNIRDTNSNLQHDLPRAPPNPNAALNNETQSVVFTVSKSYQTA